jgi:transposase InsO family protein
VVNRHLGICWEFVHVCIDDASRIAFSRVMRNERKASAVAFLEAAVAYYASLGVTVERVITDNASCYLSRAFDQACNKLGLKHIKTKPYTPKTKGKAERFIQTSLREWAMPGPMTAQTNAQQSCLDGFIATIGADPHGSIGSRPPISRLALNRNTLLRLHTSLGSFTY